MVAGSAGGVALFQIRDLWADIGIKCVASMMAKMKEVL